MYVEHSFSGENSYNENINNIRCKNINKYLFIIIKVDVSQCT